jgi:hypothetical protein
MTIKPVMTTTMTTVATMTMTTGATTTMTRKIIVMYNTSTI